MENSIVTPGNSSRDVMRTLGRKFKSGSTLSIAEDLMALSAAASLTASNYGPGPAEMQIKPPELPETVKGLLIEYAG